MSRWPETPDGILHDSETILRWLERTHAFPFLTYPVLGLPDDDPDLFHAVLARTMPAPGRRLREWVARVDAYPRA